MLFKAPRGTADILPADQAYWRYIEDKAIAASILYGYSRIDTPTFEDASLFARSVGEGTDIVNKEMYTFKDRSDNELALRPEGIASVCRAYLEHGMDNLPQPVKLYYFADIFRYERPQAGRYRQHHQFGCEAIGDASPVLDAEIIEMALTFFSSLGLINLSLNLNSIGCKKCRPVHIRKLKEYYAFHSQELCEDCIIRIEKNPLRLLDCKKPGCQLAAGSAPKSVDYLCDECSLHFEELKIYLKELGINFIINHRLVRGLDYYTKTVFEIQPAEFGSQSALGGGGRYDDLISTLGGKPTPAMGFGTGIERIVLNLKNQNISVPKQVMAVIYIACMGNDAKSQGLKMAASLRRSGVPVILSPGERSLKAQLKHANSIGVKYTAIIGDDEIKAGTVLLKNMENSEQQEILPEELPGFLSWTV